MAAAFEMYRRSAIGMSLTETLDEMVFSGALTPELAIRVLLQFDESMSAALEKKVTSRAFFKIDDALPLVSQQGSLRTYNYCDNVWTFNLRDVMFRNEEMSEKIAKLKIVACDSSLVKPKPPQQ
ncbi:hypothetical protein ACQ4PT_021866 [Festuca glaucescens]